jgi:hypothetical protein
MIMKLVTALIAAAFIAAPAAAQQTTRRIMMQSLRDLDSASYEYCRTLGVGTGAGAAISRNRPSPVRVTTSGSSTTVAAVVSGTAPFREIVVGDIVSFGAVGAMLESERLVTAKASDDSITVNAAVQLDQPVTGSSNGVTFTWRRLECGTGAENGWVYLGGQDVAAFHLSIDQMNVSAGGIDVRVECRAYGPSAVPNQIFLNNYTTAGIPSGRAVYTISRVPYDECRVGTKLGTDDGGDTGGNAEQVTITFYGGDYR